MFRAGERPRPAGRRVPLAAPACPFGAGGPSLRPIGRTESEASLHETGPSCHKCRPVPGEPGARAGIAALERLQWPPAGSHCRPHPTLPWPVLAGAPWRPSPSLPRRVAALSPSRRPVVRVWPEASAPTISERCEIALSPGTPRGCGGRSPAWRWRAGQGRAWSLRPV